MWRPRTLLEADSKTLKKDRHGRYRCPNCGVYRPAAVIVDVRSLPIPEDWACDACWTKWERQARDIDGKGRAPDRIEWAKRWAAAHGAPAEVIAKISNRR